MGLKNLVPDIMENLGLKEVDVGLEYRMINQGNWEVRAYNKRTGKIRNIWVPIRIVPPEVKLPFQYNPD